MARGVLAAGRPVTKGAGLSQVIVDDSDTLARPPEGYCAIYEIILKLCVLLMLANLTRCRLA